jgi:hypothetical protein
LQLASARQASKTGNGTPPGGSATPTTLVPNPGDFRHDEIHDHRLRYRSCCLREFHFRQAGGQRQPRASSEYRGGAKTGYTGLQQANEFDLNGHAQKAKDLLDQVNRELKEAAETSNAHGH